MDPRRAPSRTGDALLLAVAAVWGSSYLATKSLVTTVPVATVLALRFAVASLLLGVLLAARPRAAGRRRDVRAGRTRLTAVGTVLGLTQASVLALETAGVARTSATNAGLLISLTVLMTPLLDGAISRRWLPARFFAAVACAVLGVALLVTGAGLTAPSTGDALMLAAAAVRAVHVVVLSRLTRPGGPATMPLTAVQSVVCAAAFTLADPEGLAAAGRTLGAHGWLVVGYLAAACTVFAFVVQTWAVRRTSPARASLLLGTEPVWAVAVGVVLGGERLGPAGAVGAALVVAGTAAAQRVETAHRQLSAAAAAGRRPPLPRPAAEGALP